MTPIQILKAWMLAPLRILTLQTAIGRAWYRMGVRALGAGQERD